MATYRSGTSGPIAAGTVTHMAHSRTQSATTSEVTRDRMLTAQERERLSGIVAKLQALTVVPPGVRPLCTRLDAVIKGSGTPVRPATAICKGLLWPKCKTFLSPLLQCDSFHENLLDI